MANTFINNHRILRVLSSPKTKRETHFIVTGGYKAVYKPHITKTVSYVYCLWLYLYLLLWLIAPLFYQHFF